MTKKEFALAQIAPYYKDPSTCGYDVSRGCVYVTEDGRMCVFGKNLIGPEHYKNCSFAARQLLDHYGEEILKPTSRGILSSNEWRELQIVHDCIAVKEPFPEELFTLEELKEYCDKV